VNYEKVWRSIEDKYLYRLNYDCIVLDEAQRIKNRKSKQARAIKALPNVKYKWCLTGTPMENRVSELISILEFLGHWPEGRRYKGNCWDDRELLDEILWGSMLRRQFDDFDYMPPAIVNNYYIELHPYQKELYNRFLNDLIVYIRDKVFSVIHALARMVRLRQVANSVQLLDKRRSESNKLRELLILMHERVDLGEKVVVFSEFKRMCYIIKAALEKRGFSVAFIRGDPKCDVEEEKTKFENECQVMLCTKSGETGLNLQVAHNIINFELPYNPARVLQRIGRCRRIGQTKPVNVINFLGLDTIDERILEILYEKRKVFSRIIEPHSIGVQMSRALIRELVGV